MEVSSFSSDVGALREKMVSSAVKALAFEAVLGAQRSILCLFLLTGSLLKGIDDLPELMLAEKRFPLDVLHNVTRPGPENKDASDTEDDDEEDEDDDDQDDDDAGDEDFSGEEGGDDGEDGDPEDEPEANGNEGSEDEEDNDEDGDEDEDGEDDDEEEEEDEDEEDQPPAKKRK